MLRLSVVRQRLWLVSLVVVLSVVVRLVTVAQQCTDPSCNAPRNTFDGIRPSINCLNATVLRPTSADPNTHSLSDSMREAMRKLAQCGVVSFDSVWQDRQLLTEMEAWMHRVSTSCKEPSCRENYPGLLEMELELDDAMEARLMAELGVLNPLLELFLEEDYRIEFIGGFLRTASDTRQTWHSDCSRSLFRNLPVQLPPHCVTVFVPLVQCNVQTGCTEFLPGSHLRPDEPDDLTVDRLEGSVHYPEASPLKRAFPHLKLNVSAGSLIVYDYRTVHRSGRNLSGRARAVVEVNFCRKWYRDHCNAGSEGEDNN